jgi:hypothetical protein
MEDGGQPVPGAGANLLARNSSPPAPLVSTKEPLGKGPGKVMRAVRKSEQHISSLASVPITAPTSLAGTAANSLSGGSSAGGSPPSRKGSGSRAARARRGVQKVSAALDPRRLPGRLHHLSTEIMSMEVFNPLLAREVGCGRLAGNTRAEQAPDAPAAWIAAKSTNGPVTPPPSLFHPSRAPHLPTPQIAEEVREEADAGASPLAAVDAVAKRRVRALATGNAAIFFGVAAVSVSAACAAVSVAKAALRAVARPLRLGGPVAAATGLMPTGVYGALLAAYFLVHGAQGALERNKREEARKLAGRSTGATLLRDARDARVRRSDSATRAAGAAGAAPIARTGSGSQPGVRRRASIGAPPGASAPVAFPEGQNGRRQRSGDDEPSPAGWPDSDSSSPVKGASWRERSNPQLPNGGAAAAAAGGEAGAAAAAALVASGSVRRRAASLNGGASDNSSCTTPLASGAAARARPFGVGSSTSPGPPVVDEAEDDGPGAAAGVVEPLLRATSDGAPLPPMPDADEEEEGEAAAAATATAAATAAAELPKGWGAAPAAAT